MKITLNTKATIESLVYAATHEGLPPDQINYQSENGDHRKIVVAAMPRSGSTMLANVIARVTGVHSVRLCSAYSTNEHDLYLPALCFFNGLDYVSQMHIKGSFHNAFLSSRFGIKIILLMRNIFDAAVSLRDDLRRKKDTPRYDDGLNGYSFIWLDERIVDLDDAELLDCVIDLAIPWYVNFYVSWYTQCKKGGATALWMTYEEMMNDRKSAMERIFGFIGVKPPAGEIDDALAVKYETYNVAKSGRGRELLSPEQQARIRRQFSYYPDVDFSPLGL